MSAPTRVAAPYSHQMVVSHRIFRRELTLVPELVRAVPVGYRARAWVVAEHLRAVLDGLHAHHTAEDEFLWPLLLERASLDDWVILRMQTQHDQVVAAITEVTDPLQTWRRLADRPSGDALAAALDRVTAVLLPHLDEEEASVLPLADRHITAAEWARLGEHEAASTPQNQLLLQLGSILDDADPLERAELLARLPLPARMLWQVVSWQYRHHATVVRTAD